MAEQAENQVVNFDTQLKAERALYLRKTDKIPGSSLTVEQAKEAHKKTVADFEKSNLDRANRVYKEAQKTTSEFRQANGIAETSTAIVVPGVNVEIKNVPIVPVEVALTQNTDNSLELPPDAELSKMDVAELITLAGNREVEVKANVDSKAALIARIKGKYSDARFEALTGKPRAELDGFAVELGLGTDAEDLKGKFANAELLTAAIEKARKSA